MAIKLKKIRIGFFKRRVHDDIDQFRLHINGVESYLEKEAKSLINYHEERAKDLSEEEKDEYYNFYTDNYWQLSEVFPNIQRKSELIAIYTLLEHHLNSLCSIYEGHSNSQVKLCDLKANGIIETAKKYLEIVIGIKFPSSGTTWQEIKQVQRIRNLFVHNDGQLKGSEGDKRPIKQYINNSQFLKLDQYERIIITKGFSDHCLLLFNKFFAELFAAVDAFEQTI